MVDRLGPVNGVSIDRLKVTYVKNSVLPNRSRRRVNPA